MNVQAILKKPFFSDPRTLLGLWILLGVISGPLKLPSNNFLMYRQVFWHVWNGTSLFAPYPDEYFDVNHYGPFFGLLIAPFAVLPDWIAIVCWNLTMTLCLYFAIKRLPSPEKLKIAIYWFCAHELLTALFMVQFNVLIAAIIVGTWVCIEKERDWLAALLIVVGTFVKLYGIVGLAFFFFSKHKRQLVLSLIGWGALAFVLPMIISSPQYIVGQ